MSLEVYRKINSFFANLCEDERSRIQCIIKEKKFSIELNDFLNFKPKDIDENEFSSHISSTLFLFKNNRAFGKQLITSFEAILRKVLVTDVIFESRKYNDFRGITADLGIIDYTFKRLLLADMFKEMEYGQGILVIPFATCLYPLYMSDVQRINYKAIPFLYVLDIIDEFPKKELEEFNGLWRLNDDWNYARDFIKKYWAKKDKSFKISQFKKIKNIQFSNPFSFAYTTIGLFYIGKISDYLILHKKYVEKEYIEYKNKGIK